MLECCSFARDFVGDRNVCENFIPVTKTNFHSYKTFTMLADEYRYESQLPKSANDIRYYYYEGYFSDKNGYHATFSPDDYEIMKAKRLGAYGAYCDPPDCKSYSFDGMNKVYLDQTQIKERNVDYIDILSPPETDNGHFYYLVSVFMVDTRDDYHYIAILCNDDTNEIIEMSCRIIRAW